MLVKAETILRESHGDLLVSRYRLKQAEGIALVRAYREEGRQPLAFASRPFILCGLPIRRPPSDQLLFERRNGNFLLQITGHPQFGLPFGQDRLVLIFLATLAVRQKSRTVRFRSAAEMLDTFSMAKGGKEYRRIVSAFERIFGATMFFSTESTGSTATVIHRSRFNFLKEAEIWYSRSGDTPSGQNTVALSDEFYSEISRYPVPADLQAIKVLAAAPALLDLFMWLSYRCFVAKGPESIPLFGPFGLTLQLGCVEYSRPSRFRAMLEQWLQTIPALWPDCPAAIGGNGAYLRIDRSIAVLRQAENQEYRSGHLRVPGVDARVPGPIEFPTDSSRRAAGNPRERPRTGDSLRVVRSLPEGMQQARPAPALPHRVRPGAHQAPSPRPPDPCSRKGVLVPAL